MAETNEQWLENYFFTTIEDDFSMDRGEEQRVKEEAAKRGMAVPDIERIFRKVLDQHGAISERLLIEKLDGLLHQFTDKDKYLDAKEERDALDAVLIPAPGKKVGLDPRKATEYVESFCKANGVRRAGDRKWLGYFASALALLILGLGGMYFFFPDVVKQTVVKEVDSSAYSLGEKEQSEIDGHLRLAKLYVDQAQYTDPPEKSAKAELDAIHLLDPKGQYRGDEVKKLVNRIVDEYIVLAQKSFSDGNPEAVGKWLGRARLFNKNSELIREKEREFGIGSAER